MSGPSSTYFSVCSRSRRTVERTVLPERSGYFLGARMVDNAIAARGYAWATRASVLELAAVNEPVMERPRLTIVG